MSNMTWKKKDKSELNWLSVWSLPVCLVLRCSSEVNRLLWQTAGYDNRPTHFFHTPFGLISIILPAAQEGITRPHTSKQGNLWFNFNHGDNHQSRADVILDEVINLRLWHSWFHLWWSQDYKCGLICCSFIHSQHVKWLLVPQKKKKKKGGLYRSPFLTYKKWN